MSGEGSEAGPLVPESARVPRIRRDGSVVPDAVEYPLIAFPWQPWRLTAWLELTQAQARAYADWLNGTQASRVPVVVSMLGEAGAPVAGLRERPEGLVELGSWIQGWFPMLAAPLVAQGFLHDDPIDRLGEAWVAWGPTLSDFSWFGDALLHSLAHDLAFLVTDCARAVRPGLRWQAVDDNENFIVTVDANPPLFDVILQVKDFLVQSVARQRGARSAQLRRWYSRLLYGCYQRAATGVGPPQKNEEFPDLRIRMYGRYKLARPSRTDPPAPPELIAVVAAFRQAGWFETSKLDNADLARAAQMAWRQFEREPIPLAATELHWRLLLLDTGRTWSEDVDAGITLQDRFYHGTLFAIERVGGKGFGHFRDPSEDWASRPGDLLLSFGWRSRRYQVPIPRPGRYLSPALFTGLNALMPEDGKPRLWFFDHGPPIAIVTRATAAERDALERLTGIRLDMRPPGWWTALAPLPESDDRALAQLPPAPRRARPEDLIPPPFAPGSGAGAGCDSVPPSLQVPPAEPARARSKAPAGGAPTAQKAFEHLMAVLVGPVLRELGFSGRVRSFRYRRGDYEGAVETQKSRYSTKERVEFSIELGAAYIPTGVGYWSRTLEQFNTASPDRWWAVQAGELAEPVATEILAVFRAYGWPAIQAALDSPGYPPDPATRWARTFPSSERAAAHRVIRSALDPVAWVLHPAGRAHDEAFADLADGDASTRWLAVDIISREAIDDPRAVPALLNRLEHDPAADIRRLAACRLRLLAHRQEVYQAFQMAAAEDEDLEVRWEARYALRLADSSGPGTA